MWRRPVGEGAKRTRTASDMGVGGASPKTTEAAPALAFARPSRGFGAAGSEAVYGVASVRSASTVMPGSMR